MKRKKENYKKYLRLLLFCILLFSITSQIHSRFINNEGNLRNSGGYEPSGLIAMWSGPLDTIPEGWKLCDGTDGTLNISNRFVCGTDNMEEPGITGGGSSHNHNYTTVPYHDHGETDTATCRHSHDWDGPGARLQVMEGNTVGLFNNGVTGSDPANHSHNVDYTGQAISYTSEEENILPPYYKLVFIEKEKKDAVIPIGLITMWAGTIENIPEGWAFCNGLNGTPDLQEKFIRGVLPGEEPGSLGGNLSHIHTYTDIPNHTHSLSIGGYNHVHPGAFEHIPRYRHYTGVGSVYVCGQASASYTEYTDLPHTHTINEIGIESCTTQNTDHLPPYFKMAFIMNKEVTDALPVGSISMWGDSIMDIPSGWNQCNGTHNTPNMLNRFPRGIASGEQPGIIGGSTTHRHIYTEVPLHTHIVFEDPMRHRHSMDGFATPWVAFPSMPFSGFPVLIPSQASYSSQSNAPHNHDVLPTGSSTCYTSYENNLPPFIKLIYIQKNIFIYNPTPDDGNSGIGYSPTLSVDVSDLEGDDLIITFYDASDDGVIDSDVISGGSGTASVIWSGLSSGTSYSWYVIADDGSITAQSNTWSFTTNQVPNEPTNPSPADQATDINYNPTLSVDVYDVDGNDLIVTFHDGSDDSIIGADTVFGGSSTASVNWSGLLPATNYIWYVIVDDGFDLTQSSWWRFTTSEEVGAGDGAPAIPMPNLKVIGSITIGAAGIISVITYLKRIKWKRKNIKSMDNL